MHRAKEVLEERKVTVNGNIFKFFITLLFVRYDS